MVIVGKQAIDDDANQTGQMLSALLGWGQGAFASGIKVEGDVCQRDSRNRWRPCRMSRSSCLHVMTADLRLNEPRYASLPNIMKAKKKAA